MWLFRIIGCSRISPIPAFCAALAAARECEHCINRTLRDDESRLGTFPDPAILPDPSFLDANKTDLGGWCMAARAVGDIRNLALVGHSAAGKTTLGEALLLK